MKQIIILMVLAGLMIFGLIVCSDDPLSLEDHQGLVGSWQWTETCYPYPTECITPETEGYTRRLSFGSDLVYEEWRNDTLLTACRYSIIRGDIGDGVMRSLLVFDCLEDTLVFLFEDPNTLTLSLGMAGSSVERFTRLRTGVPGAR